MERSVSGALLQFGLDCGGKGVVLLRTPKASLKQGQTKGPAPWTEDRSLGSPMQLYGNLCLFFLLLPCWRAQSRLFTNLTSLVSEVTSFEC